VAQLISEESEEYALAHTSAFEGPIGDAATWTQANMARPQMMSGVAEARLLEALIVVGGARRVLEIGTFTAVGTLMMAAAVGDGGHVTTLERDPEYAAAARRHIAASTFADRVELIEGDALEMIPRLDGPFDLVYIDAWKSDYPDYYDAVMPKLAPRGVIVADNLFRGGASFDETDQDESTIGIREFARRVQADLRTHNVLLTIGDGVMLVWPRPGPAGPDAGPG
jgi:caffeoyl-CoA O-methyltransferase